ncbi:hypothetical protein PRIO_5544 [Paenibacillus riograndensis SBR5]|uniref:Uncharacterized protein n=1 Tax=Paenibacillus riograndensis SBR5 TaxID=1073571 RepID=A0A0E4HER5_9BACL|nr:hypothetical protein PRIO_5544 [Paenibacillus riograndensis SBR5]
MHGTKTAVPSSTGQRSRLGSSVTWRTTPHESYGNSLSGKRLTNLPKYPTLGQMKWKKVH